MIFYILYQHVLKVIFNQDYNQCSIFNHFYLLITLINIIKHTKESINYYLLIIIINNLNFIWIHLLFFNFHFQNQDFFYLKVFLKFLVILSLMDLSLKSIYYFLYNSFYIQFQRSFMVH